MVTSAALAMPFTPLADIRAVGATGPGSGLPAILHDGTCTWITTDPLEPGDRGSSSLKWTVFPVTELLDTKPPAGGFPTIENGAGISTSRSPPVQSATDEEQPNRAV